MEQAQQPIRPTRVKTSSVSKPLLPVHLQSILIKGVFLSEAGGTQTPNVTTVAESAISHVIAALDADLGLAPTSAEDGTHARTHRVIADAMTVTIADAHLIDGGVALAARAMRDAMIVAMATMTGAVQDATATSVVMTGVTTGAPVMTVLVAALHAAMALGLQRIAAYAAMVPRVILARGQARVTRLKTARAVMMTALTV